MEEFKVGDMVRWTSQAQGSERTKIGVVAEVVPIDARPDPIRFAALYRNSGCGHGRKHVSYVVEVGGKKKPYWPVVTRLRRDE
jgi:hypothetical protein